MIRRPDGEESALIHCRKNTPILDCLRALESDQGSWHGHHLRKLRGKRARLKERARR